jgi:LAO/AO transport system kinase
VHPDAYIRPSPTSGTLGGVAKATRETIVLLEAAGFDVILVETVGVGQSEVTVANMVDTFVFLTLARTGDQLQGIKKGVLELADIVVVNKADGAHAAEAKKAARELTGAIRLIYPRETLWRPPVLTMSAVEGSGLTELWDTVLKHRQVLTRRGGVRSPQARAAGGLDVVDGPRHRAGPGAVASHRPQDPRRGGTAGARRRADPRPCCATAARRG